MASAELKFDEVVYMIYILHQWGEQLNSAKGCEIDRRTGEEFNLKLKSDSSSRHLNGGQSVSHAS